MFIEVNELMYIQGLVLPSQQVGNGILVVLIVLAVCIAVGLTTTFAYRPAKEIPGTHETVADEMSKAA